MAKKKRATEVEKQIIANDKGASVIDYLKNFGANPIVWVVLGVLLVLVVVMLALKDGGDEEISSAGDLTDSCIEYARSGARFDFCKYNLVSGNLINCRDGDILDEIADEGIDVNLPSLSCRSVNTYDITKAACKTLAPDKPSTKISALESNFNFVQGDSTCGQFYRCTGTSDDGVDCTTYTDQGDCENGCLWAIP